MSNTSISSQFIKAINQTGIAFISFFLLLPLSLIVPKKKNRIAVIGRQNGLFTDNAKHFYLFLRSWANPKPDVFYIVFDKNNFEQLAISGEQVLCYPTLRAILFLLTANLVVTDSAEWITNGKFQLTFGSKIVQLWHGAPLKQIELPLFYERIEKYPFIIQNLFKIYKSLIGGHCEYELVVSTSSYFTEKIFRHAFRSKHFVESGYPRNDALFQSTTAENLDKPLYINTDLDVARQMLAKKQSGTKIYIYAPTFRKNDIGSSLSSHIDLDRLNDFATQHNILFIFKLHPILSGSISLDGFSNIVEYKANCDIYPVLNLANGLITDYSSIYFDYLLIDKPVIFYPYDLNQYITSDRSLLFDYEQMAPGQICMSQNELEQAMLIIEEDLYQEKRNEILNLVFTHTDNMASARIWEFLRDKYMS